VKKIGSPEVRVVLNGGGDVLDSATIPIEWGLSRKILDENPQFIIISDVAHTLDWLEKLENGFQNSRKNNRMFRATELIGYIPVYSPGSHTFVIHVVCGGKRINAFKAAENLISSSIWHENIELGFSETYEDGEKIGIYTIAVECEIPKEFFAEKPKTGFSKFVWSWTNRWFGKDPIDECAYRKRKIFAFTLQPILFVVIRLIAGILGTLYVLVASFYLFLLGIRPESPLKNIKKCWTKPVNFDGDLRRFRTYKFFGKWRILNESPKKVLPWYFVPVFIPFEIYLVYLAIITSFNGVKNLYTTIGVYYGTILLLVIVFLFIFRKAIVRLLLRIDARIGTYIDQRAEEEKKSKGEKKETQIQEKDTKEGRIRHKNISFLKNYAFIDNLPRRVEVAKIAKVVDTVTRFKISFWSTKAKVCKPFVG